MTNLKLKYATVILVFVMTGSSAAMADIVFKMDYSNRNQPQVGNPTPSVIQSMSAASGIISAVDFVEMRALQGRAQQNIVAVTFNRTTSATGDALTDTIFFTGVDAPLGLSLSGAIGKKISANIRNLSFTIIDK